MYTSHMPEVSRGTRLVVEYAEKFWCPSFTSTDITGKEAFRFKEDKRKKSRK